MRELVQFCEHCGAQFLAPGARRFCSRQCCGKFMFKANTKRAQSERATNVGESTLCRSCGEPMVVARPSLFKCQSCERERLRSYRAENVDRLNARQRELAKRPEARAKMNARARSLRKIKDQKVMARKAVTNAIESGRLVQQPCVRCGQSPTDAHHEDYGRPLDVTWLCRSCHRSRHGLRNLLKRSE